MIDVEEKALPKVSGNEAAKSLHAPLEEIGQGVADFVLPGVYADVLASVDAGEEEDGKMKRWKEPREYHIVTFKDTGGVHVPLHPWPQYFYVSHVLLAQPVAVLRPLTFTGLLKGVGRNVISMSYWRFMYLLYRAGFLDTEEYAQFSFSHDFRLDFWKVRADRRKKA